MTDDYPLVDHAPPAALALDFPWGQRVVVPADGLHIGRACALLSGQVHDDGQVAWRHARLWWRDGELLVDDCDSTTRTWVDGEPITAGRPVPLRPGQCLSLGPNLHVRVVTPDQPDRQHGRALA